MKDLLGHSSNFGAVNMMHHHLGYIREYLRVLDLTDALRFVNIHLLLSIALLKIVAFFSLLVARFATD
jgi:hypothetical protein